MKCYLRIGDDPLEKAKRFHSVTNATRAYERVAEELARYGQAIGGTIHIAKSREELAEYPDYELTYDGQYARRSKL